jgi:hypothetical protein
MPAPFLRRCLALYLDFGFFWLVWEIAHIGADGGADALYIIPAFLLLRFALRYSIGTPGRFLLSIDRSGQVDAEIKDGESWLTILMGVVLVKGGLGSISAGLTLPVPIPQFGVLLDPSLGAALCAGWGAVSLFAGFLMFKLSPAGLWFGLASTLLGVLSYFTSLELMPGFWRAVFAIDDRADALEPQQAEVVVALLTAGMGIYVAVAGLMMVVGLLFTLPRLTRIV